MPTDSEGTNQDHPSPDDDYEAIRAAFPLAINGRLSGIRSPLQTRGYKLIENFQVASQPTPASDDAVIATTTAASENSAGDSHRQAAAPTGRLVGEVEMPTQPGPVSGIHGEHNAAAATSPAYTASSSAGAAAAAADGAFSASATAACSPHCNPRIWTQQTLSNGVVNDSQDRDDDATAAVVSAAADSASSAACPQQREALHSAVAPLVVAYAGASATQAAVAVSAAASGTPSPSVAAAPAESVTAEPDAAISSAISSTSACAENPSSA